MSCDKKLVCFYLDVSLNSKQDYLIPYNPHLHNPNNDEVCWTSKDDLEFFMVSFSANAIMFDHVALDIGLLCHFMVSNPVFH